MKRTIYNILITIYAIIAVFTTVCLLSFNEYKISVLGNHSLILITDDELSPDYNKGDLVIVDGSNNKKINVGEKIFFYVQEGKEINVSLAQVQKRDIMSSTETTYTIEGESLVSSGNTIGQASTATVIPKVGSVLAVLESKWGFLFLIVFPSLIAFLYEIGVVISEIRASKKEE